MEPDRARQLLQRERERIQAELSSLRAAHGDGDDELARVDQHTADAGSELFENERDQSMITRLQQELEVRLVPEADLQVDRRDGTPVDPRRHAAGALAVVRVADHVHLELEVSRVDRVRAFGLVGPVGVHLAHQLPGVGSKSV